MTVPMAEGVQLSAELPEWVKLAIADAVVLSGRIEQEIIEIMWIEKDANFIQKLKLAETPVTRVFLELIDIYEKKR
ncbi:MAG: hypothetical protein HQL37_02120 [Alphaproteobacteria bacterium]|nr:hypothetical protein [Alphaproteobacteria bacterium]